MMTASTIASPGSDHEPRDHWLTHAIPLVLFLAALAAMFLAPILVKGREPVEQVVEVVRLRD